MTSGIINNIHMNFCVPGKRNIVVKLSIRPFVRSSVPLISCLLYIFYTHEWISKLPGRNVLLDKTVGRALKPGP